MDEPAGFDRIRVGQHVKVRGVSTQDGSVQAVEIKCQEPKPRVVLEGMARFDPGGREITVMGRSIVLPEGMALLGADGHRLSPQAVRSPVRVKVVVRGTEALGFQVESVQLKETLDFIIEKLRGPVDRIDREGSTLVVAGVTVRVTPHTTVERSE